MDLRKLTHSFYVENCHLEEALDNVNGSWQANKARGYGVVIIDINSLTFAIPLRSNIKHKASYITKTVKSNSGNYKKGLDFSKALLIREESYISDELFKIPTNEHRTLKDKGFYINGKFTKYVEKYVSAATSDDMHILRNPEYRYTTLINYHSDLGIEN